jgi:hypothetical protein
MAQHEQKGDAVTITINNASKQTTVGVHTVADIKTLGGVPLADDLDEVKDAKLHPLADGASTNIKGGETFISHPKDSSSS